MLKAPSRTEIEETIQAEIRSVLAERGQAVGPIRGSDGLNAVLGFTSLDLATLVAELESALGIDPFAKVVAITSVRTVNDLVEAYLKACSSEATGAEKDDGLLEASRRGSARRARRGG